MVNQSLHFHLRQNISDFLSNIWKKHPSNLQQGSESSSIPSTVLLMFVGFMSMETKLRITNSLVLMYPFSSVLKSNNRALLTKRRIFKDHFICIFENPSLMITARTTANSLHKTEAWQDSYVILQSQCKAHLPLCTRKSFSALVCEHSKHIILANL